MSITQENIDLYFEALAKCGVVTPARTRANISRSSAYRLHEQYPERYAEAKSQFLDTLEEVAIDRAMNGTKKGVWFQGAKCGEETVYSDSLLIKVLESKHPEYKRTQAVELSGGLDKMGDSELLAELAKLRGEGVEP